MSAQSLIPAGCSFLNPNTIITTKGKDFLLNLLEKADKRDPDAFNMYIYNDFFGYGVLDLVDKALSKIHATIKRKDWTEAYSLLEALTCFNNIQSVWITVDDGEHANFVNQVYGASLVTTLRALKEEGRLDATHFPTLETLLRKATEWASSASLDGDYGKVCKAIGKRLFGKKSPETIQLEKARLEEWIASLDKGDQAAVKRHIEEAEEDETEKVDWFKGAQAVQEDADDDDFILSRVWKEYKQCLSSVPNKPLRGPPVWDLSRWSEADKRPFHFDNMEDGDSY